MRNLRLGSRCFVFFLSFFPSVYRLCFNQHICGISDFEVTTWILQHAYWFIFTYRPKLNQELLENIIINKVFEPLMQFKNTSKIFLLGSEPCI